MSFPKSILELESARKPANEWLKIQPEDYQNPMDGYWKHLIKVKMAKGHLTKYSVHLGWI